MQIGNSSKTYYNKGIMQYEKGQYNLSIKNFEKAIKLDKSNYEYHYNLGLAYIKIEEYDRAIESFKNGILLYPRDSDIYLNLGIAFFNKGEFQKAINAYNKAISLNHDPESFSNAGIAYFSLKKYEEAIKNFKLAVKLEPKNPTYNYNLAYSYYVTEQYDLAEESLISAINYNKQDYEALFLMGQIALKQFDEQLAKKYFESVLQVNPDHEGAKTALEEIELKKYRKSEVKAEPQPEPIVETKTETEETERTPISSAKIEADKYYNSALQFFEKKEYEAAIEELNKTLTLVDNHSEAIEAFNIVSKLLKDETELYNKGVLHFSKNEFAKSINYLEKAIAIYPHDKKAKELLNKAIDKNKEMSKAYVDSCQYDLAVESLKAILQEDPKDLNAHFTLGNVYIQQKEYDLALDSLRNILNLDPEHKEAQDFVYNIIKETNSDNNNDTKDYFNLSLIYINKQDYFSALQSLKKVIELNPDNPKAKSLIYKITETLNNKILSSHKDTDLEDWLDD